MTRVMKVVGESYVEIGYHRIYPPALVDESGRYLGPMLREYKLAGYGDCPLRGANGQIEAGNREGMGGKGQW